MHLARRTARLRWLRRLCSQYPRRDVELREDGALSSAECEVVLYDPVDEPVDEPVDR
jgi:hypothetical protein